MGKITPNYKTAVIDSLLNSISSNTDIYYAFGADATGSAAAKDEDYSVNLSQSYPLYSMQFGKRIFASDIKPIIRNIVWAYGSTYDYYDDEDPYLSEKNYYVVTPQTVTGGYRHVFKCLDNKNSGPSYQQPDLIQSDPFTKSDGYTWKYMYSISQSDYTKWATDSYVPVIANNDVVIAASSGGLNKIVIENSGTNYINIHDGIIQSIPSSTLVQIEDSASGYNGYYTKSSVYMYNTENQTGQLRTISDYVANSSGKWLTLTKAANTSLVHPGTTQYYIAPSVKIYGDGDRPAVAYSTVDANTHQISNIVIVDSGENYSYCTAKIISNPSYGSGAVIRPIIPPPGGHGSKPSSELNALGYAVYIAFEGSEGGDIQTNGPYSTVGIMRNPKAYANTMLTYVANAFSQLMVTSISDGSVFTVGETIIGQNTSAEAIVFESNTTSLILTGDKHFANGEVIIGQTSGITTNININTVGTIYPKDVDILYYQNIPVVNRSTSQTETYKLIVAV